MRNPPIPAAEVRSPGIGRWLAVAAALTGAIAAAISCAPQPDVDEIEECGCSDPGDSDIQCLLKVENGLLTQQRWETTCADLSDSADVGLACEVACGEWGDGPNKCIETVKQPNSSNPQFQVFLCDGTGYGGTDGLPPLDDGSTPDGGDGADSTGAAAPAWEPGSYIDYNTSLDVYIIDQALVDAIKGDPTLLALDGTIVEERTTSGFEFQNITTGSLADILGLQDGDVIRNLNGHTMNTMEDALNTLAAVYDATSLSLQVNRSGTVISFDYLIR